MTKQTPLVVTCCLMLAACAGGNSAIPRDPHDVQVTEPGQATCLKTTLIQNNLGAQSTNSMRRRASLPPVQANMLLADVAARHACDMARRGLMTHRGTGTPGPGARVKANGYQPRVTAENIAACPFNLGRVLVEWNASEGHRNNILIPQVSDYGIGQAIGPDGRTRFWAAVYAAPK